MKTKAKGLTSDQLKLIACCSMLIDHITYTFLEMACDPATEASFMYSSDSLYALYLIGRILGRQAFPIFAFFIVEGFFHTRNRKSYLERLGLFAVISQVPYYLMVNTGNVGSERSIQTNVYITLALGLAAICTIDFVQVKIEEKSNGIRKIAGISLKIFVAVAACIISVLLNSDYSYIGIITILIFYFLRNDRKKAILAVWVWLTINSVLEVFTLPGLLLLLLYNGQKNNEKLCIPKMFFYSFYPLHMLILSVIRIIVFG